jgi:hypothetical protein
LSMRVSKGSISCFINVIRSLSSPVGIDCWPFCSQEPRVDTLLNPWHNPIRGMMLVSERYLRCGETKMRSILRDGTQCHGQLAISISPYQFSSFIKLTTEKPPSLPCLYHPLVSIRRSLNKFLRGFSIHQATQPLQVLPPN